ncbi:MAG: L-rhamnose mutarotase [Propionibacteriaceae bacterium]|nr:L-rhamnose mutarotase [Propionibacteriaceae bacterium]
MPSPAPRLTRYCLLGHVDPVHLDLYKQRHAAVWPALLEALRDAGWHNYSLFLRDDGLLIGYVEAVDLDEAQARVAATEVNTRWQAEMSALFASEGAPDEAWERLDLVFNLEDQLQALRPRPPEPPDAEPRRQAPRRQTPNPPTSSA